MHQTVNILILVVLHDIGNVVLHNVCELSGTEVPCCDKGGKLLVPDEIVASQQLASLFGDARNGVAIDEAEFALRRFSLVELLGITGHNLSPQGRVSQNVLIVFAIEGDIVGLRAEVEKSSFDSQVMQLRMHTRARSSKEKSECQHFDFEN